MGLLWRECEVQNLEVNIEGNAHDMNLPDATSPNLEVAIEGTSTPSFSITEEQIPHMAWKSLEKGILRDSYCCGDVPKPAINHRGNNSETTEAYVAPAAFWAALATSRFLISTSIWLWENPGPRKYDVWTEACTIKTPSWLILAPWLSGCSCPPFGFGNPSRISEDWGRLL